MNDTDTEARRLLAAATQDMPPGTDLLAGFARARRNRGRRTRWRVAASAGVAAAAAAVTAAVLVTGSAPPALATVTSALSRTMAQSYHLTRQDQSHYTQNGRNTGHGQVTCTSEVDPVRRLQADACADGFREIVVGDDTYIYVAKAAGHPGKHWWRARLSSQLHTGIPGFVAPSPQQLLAQIRKADKVTVVGPVSGPGWSGTRYAFSLATAQFSKLTGVLSQLATVSGTVDVDQQGRARALTQTLRTAYASGLRFVITQVLTFSDFGVPVRITPPPADQTFSGLP